MRCTTETNILEISCLYVCDGLYASCPGHSLARTAHTDRVPSNVKWPEGLKFCTDRPTFSTRRQSNFSLISIRQIAAESDDYIAPGVHPTKALVITKGNAGWPGDQISTGTGLGALLVCRKIPYISSYNAQPSSNKPFAKQNKRIHTLV